MFDTIQPVSTVKAAGEVRKVMQAKNIGLAAGVAVAAAAAGFRSTEKFRLYHRRHRPHRQETYDVFDRKEIDFYEGAELTVNYICR